MTIVVLVWMLRVASSVLHSKVVLQFENGWVMSMTALIDNCVLDGKMAGRRENGTLRIDTHGSVASCNHALNM